MFSCYASEAPELYRLAEQIAQLVNRAFMFWDLRQLDEPTRRGMLAELRQEFEEAVG